MEELQSTEVLDREILEDARRKAQRILKTADDEAAAAGAGWNAKADEALAGLRKRHNERLELGRIEVMARLPLDKRRLRLQKIDSLLHDAACSFFSGLDRENLLGVLADSLAERVREIAGDFQDGEGWRSGNKAPVRAAYRFLSQTEAESLLEKTFPRGKIGPSLPAGPPDKSSWIIQEGDAAYVHGGQFPGIVVDLGKVRISVSADDLIESLLKEKRGELASALLGEGALDA
ncbi:MAG: hypothetical protein LBT16_10375 [Treponema sp.]|jgi:hypothetical protein|nr:hypothetical protein [Treponema sp.]